MTISRFIRYLARDDVRVVAAFAVVVGLTAEISRALSIEAVSMSVLWPPTGLILGAALLYGWPILVVCGLVLSTWLVFFESFGVAAALIQITCQLAGVGSGLVYLRRWGRLAARAPTSLLDRIGYLKAGILVASVSAGLGSVAIWLGSSEIRDFSIQDVFLVYWLIEILSVVLFAPLAYFVLDNPGRFFKNVVDDLRQPTTAGSLLCLLVIALAVFALPGGVSETYTFAIAFMIFPSLCWLVLTGHPAVITLALPLIALILVAFLTLGIGPVPQMTTVEGAVRLLLLFAASALLLQIITVVTFSRNQLIETLRQQADTDFLSGLRNDRAFLAVINEEIIRRRQLIEAGPATDRKSWLIYLEVLDFDNLEDLMGFRARRTMETLFSARLMGTAGPDCKPARLGSGIFAAVFDAPDPKALDQFLSSVYQAFDGQSFSVGDHQTRIRVSMGAVALEDSLEDPNQYLSAATQASLMARDRLPRIQKIENPKSITLDRMGLTERLELLKEALSEDRLVLFAQPILPLGPHETELSYEILLRLSGEDGQYISPGVFLPVAEAYGFMKQIDQWVIRSTLSALAANPEWLARTRKCSINLAGVSLSSGEIVDSIEQAFQLTGVPKDKIAFEITETQQISRREEAEAVTEKLKTMGCGVSLDDFGTGLATFDYLKSFQFDTVKIDGLFIKNIENSEDDRRIVRAICDVARWMKLTTVAEFVEDKDTVNLLRELGVDYGQGYGLGKPVPLQDMFAQLTESAEST